LVGAFEDDEGGIEELIEQLVLRELFAGEVPYLPGKLALGG